MTAKSIFRWAGSKSRLLGSLTAYWDSAECSGKYVEPFAGSGCLFFSIQPKAALLNDINKHLINAMIQLRGSANALYEAVAAIPRNADEYYAWRARRPCELSDFDNAVRFVYLNRNCFNGLWRTNSKGEFNVPYGGGNKAGMLPSRKRFTDCARALKSAELLSVDFEELLRTKVSSNDFVYLDPPYAVSNRRMFRQYSGQTFGIEDLGRLSKQLIEIDRRGAKFLLSYAESPEVEILSQGWMITRKSIHRNISGFSKHRRIDREVFITNIDS